MRLAYLTICLSLAVLGSGCSAKKSDSEPFQPKQTLPIPDDLRDSVEQARLLGLAMYTQDAASAVATDVLVEKIGSLDGKGLGGWVTMRDADVGGRQTGWWLVKFFSEETEPRILYEVRVPTRAGEEPTFAAIDPPRRPDGNSRNLIHARSAAIAAIPPPTRPMNTVLLPGQPFGFEGTLVYLLAATTEPNVMVLGKHYRVLLTGIDFEVTSVTELSRSELQVPLKPGEDGHIRPPLIKHTLSDGPTENYVFASLFHRTPILVATSRGVWWIDGSEIRLIAEQLPQRASELFQ